ncbi:jasmonic acid-amido synthetase JAR1 [Canna indica]|uniref:Jasmonic acid-amido synthetase JAR1 n=1 Tax=Canna indica TaxID=4628 RepID=A0AAQ3KSY1_9LILI|nr:jasmonic acid-amido synthetase JAR1 [Canna indica]
MAVEGPPMATTEEDVEDVVAWFEEVADNAATVQLQTLRHIVESNLGAEYLQKWLGALGGLGGMSPAALQSLYTSAVPLVSHADLEPYINRIAHGDSSPVLTQHPITMLSLSSGTTDGRPKYVPFTRFSSQSTLQIFRLAAAYRSMVFPIRSGGRILEFIYSSKQFQTKGGLTVGTATTHYFASEEFKTKQRSTKCFTCSPQEVICGGDYKQSTYCHLLLGLLFHDEVEFVASTFAYSIVQAFAAFEEQWEELCEDLRKGTLSTKVTSPKMRKAVLEKLAEPNPSLASEVERTCRELRSSEWGGLIPALWPNSKYVYSIMTGSMQPYLKKLRHYAGELSLVSAEYGSTEGWIGVNLEPMNPPERVVFTVIPTFAYFEFIPLFHKQQSDHGRERRRICASDTDDFVEGEPVPLSSVTVGQQYEIVLTTFTGLYRYRLGDVVEVAGFYKGAPQLSFVCRRKLILTVNIDKNTERDLQVVVEKGRSLLSRSATKAELVDFTSHADVAHCPGHYVIYWELKGEAEEGVLEECCRAMDAAFVDEGYVVSRKTSSIGPLELRIVAGGTFHKILEHCIGNGAAMSQFKTPRCTANEVLLGILDCSTIKRFWSTAYG